MPESSLTDFHSFVYYVDMLMKMKKVLIYLLIASLLSGSVLSGTASVFCMTEDGHGEIESYYSNCCSEVIIPELPVDNHDKADECSDCSDIEITNHVWVNRNSIEKIDSVCKLTSCNLSFAQFQKNIFNHPDFQYHKKFKPEFKFLQVFISTTVLNC